MAQAAFPFALTQPGPASAQRPAGRHPLATQPQPELLDSCGYAIGWDHAHHQLTPPLAHLHADSPVRQGWQAGRAAFGQRTLKAGAAVRQWLALRLAAWQHGQAFEGVQVTPHFLGQIDATHCPVSRMPLLLATGRAEDALVQRLNPDAAYAAGNLVVLSRAAAEARAALSCQALLVQAQRLAETPGQQLRGLNADAWLRLAVLSSFATPLPHGLAASLPLRVLPPNRVRVINPVQALQVMLTLQFTQGAYARRLLTLAALMPSSEVRQTFQIFMHTLLARRLAAGQGLGPEAARPAMEDSWADPLVLRRWQRLALRLTPADCEQLLQRASQRGLWVGGGRGLSPQAATEGWAMDLAPGQGSGQVELPGRADQVDQASQTDQAGSALRGPAPSSMARQRGSQKLAS